jgi:hypothetical protein
MALDTQGPQGIQGPTGPTGAAGTPGENWFSGSGAPAGGLGVVNDWYLDSVTGDFYEKTATTTWTLRGNLKGPTGATGATGGTGPTGPQGNPGVINAVQDEGSPLTGRANLNFIGAGVTATDDAANNRTNVTVSAALPATKWCRVRRSADLNLTASFQTITWDIEDADTDTIHDLVTNTDRLTCKTAGVYDVSLTCEVGGIASPLPVIQVLKNGTLIPGSRVSVVGGGTSGPSVLTVALPIALVVNDFLQAQINGGKTGYAMAAANSHFSTVMLGT